MKLIHMFSKVREDGAVSPLCAKRPRAIDLGRATWTRDPRAVTCKKCLAAMGEDSSEVELKA